MQQLFQKQIIEHPDAVSCAGGIGGAFGLAVQFVDDGLDERHGDMFRCFECEVSCLPVLDEADPFEARAFEDQSPFRTDDRHFIQVEVRDVTPGGRSDDTIREAEGCRDRVLDFIESGPVLNDTSHRGDVTEVISQIIEHMHLDFSGIAHA